MNRRAVVLSLLLGSLLGNASGCLFVRHKTNVVRENEPQRQARFESEQAKQYFEGGVHELQAVPQLSNFNVSAMPLLWWYSSATALSANAIYNDQITACDTNGDGMISTEEATAYRAGVAERVRVAETKNASAVSTGDTASPLKMTKPANSSTPPSPPALINISSHGSS